MARETINGISVPIPGTGEPADFVSDLRQIATDLSASFASPATITIAAADTQDARQANLRCDGTDDQNVINGAMALLSATRGGKVLLLDGTFNISDRIVIPKSRVVLEGSGWGFWDAYVDAGPLGPATGTEGGGVTKIKASAPGFDLLEVDNGSVFNNAEDRLAGVVIRNLYLYGNGYTGKGIKCVKATGAINSTDQLIIERVFVHNTNTGMQIEADCPYITNCTIMDVASNGLVLGETVGVAGQVHHNVIADIGGDGITVGVGAQFVEISDNIVVRCQLGIYVAADRALVTENRVWDCRGVGISVHTQATVTGNTVRGCNSQQIKVENGGTARGSIVSNNNVEATRTQDPGIYIHTANDCIIEGNWVLAYNGGTGDNGFGLMLDTSTGCIVRGNRIVCEDATTTGYNVGLSVDAASAAGAGVCTDNVVTGGFATRVSVPPATATFIVRDNIAAA